MNCPVGDTEIEKVTNNKRKVIPPPALIVDDKGDTWVPHHNPNKPPRKRKPGQCPHARQKDRCKDCGGSAICVHGKQKRFCRACDGSAFCPHGRQKARCKGLLSYIVYLCIRTYVTRQTNE